MERKDLNKTYNTLKELCAIHNAFDIHDYKEYFCELDILELVQASIDAWKGGE